MQKPFTVLSGIVGVLGRILLCVVFLAAAVGYTDANVLNVAQFLAARGMLAPMWALVGGVVFLVMGSLSIIFGYQSRIGALLLLLFLGVATYWFHGFSFWSLVNAQVLRDHITFLATNVSLIGALLFIMANGTGKLSLDARRR
ncbi:MAG: DoxX family protein [Thermoguttaceae bacterium]|jgi:putative oxidoreductase